MYVSSVMKLPKDKKVYVIGEAGLEEELHEEGFTTLGGTVRRPVCVAPRSSPAGPRGQHCGPVLAGDAPAR